MKALHILYQSYPNISGSSTRTADILANQKKIGIETVAITSPFQSGIDENNVEENISGIMHYRTYSGRPNEEVKEDSNNFTVKILKLTRILFFKKEIFKVVLKEKPNILHAHAMFFCAYPTIILGKKMNLPVLYEVRSLWEERRKDSYPRKFSSVLECFILRKIETFCIKKADHIITISENLKKNLVGRGIPNEKITVVANAVDLDFIEKQAIQMSKRKNDSMTFGYVGSVSPIEGLWSLIKLFQTCFRDDRLLIYGPGKNSEISKLRLLIKDFDNIEYGGVVERDQIYKAYENIDVIVNPRAKLKITDTVTPLKPLEAMAFDKILIASDVGGLKELIVNNKTGFLFEAENLKSLENCISKVKKLPVNELNDIKSRASDFIKNQRNWFINAQTYKELYRRLSDARKV
ncbi:glycosyltransferase family 4 protein [Akkermansiaceae bacterium]|nr:glycosyltransferase family 4 protein [Akkermansiaceae bacterium]